MADPTAYTFVLIHGTWHDGSAWSRVAAELTHLGHRAHAPTLAGHGKGESREASHEDCVQSVIAYLRENDLSDVVLVGHSLGGTVIPRVAEELPERIRRLVFSNAFVPLEGESFEDLLPPPIRGLLGSLTRPDGGVLPAPFPLWREAFIGDADIELAREAYAALLPSPRRSQTDKLRLRSFHSLQIPKSFLFATEDVSLPPGPEWGYHPRLSGRLGLYRLVQMPGCHEVATTDPARMAAKLIEAGRD